MIDCSETYLRGYKNNGIYLLWLQQGYQFGAFYCDMYNGKVLVVRLNNAAFSYIRSSYVSPIIDVARTVFTKAKFACPPYQRLLLSAISAYERHVYLIDISFIIKFK